MKLLVEQGILPKKYKNCEALKCPGCLYGKQHRTPWHTSKRNCKKLKIAFKPGDCVSVDIMQSSVDGFVPQQKGSILTTSRFVGAVIFVDHKTDFTFAVPITSLMAEEMVRAKQQFELFADKCRVKIRHYHADNGTFAAKLYMDSCKRANQGLNFCGVNAHHQNG